MITEAMRRAGWRECPSDEVRRAWEEKGGRWQYLHTSQGAKPDITPYVASFRPEARFVYVFRPVSAQTWDYDPRGWGKVMPTEPGLWWREGITLPVRVKEDGPPWGGFCWQPIDCDDDRLWYHVHPDGWWLAPCVKSEVMP